MVQSRYPASRLTLVALAIILAGAATLRLWGIESGAPFRMGVDEPIVLETSVRMVKSGDFDPRFFDYGGLTFEFHAVVTAFSFLQRAASGRWRSLDQTWYGDFLAPTRMATALVGTLTVWLVFRIGLRWGPAAALVGALVLAVLPSHVRESHFTLTDTPLTFLTALTLLLSLRAAESKRQVDVALAGAAIGLAAAVKYNGAIVCVLPALAAWTFPAGTRLRTLAVAAGASIVAFLAAAPYTLLNLPGFLNGFAALMQSYNRPHFTAWDAALTYLGHLRNWFGWPGVLPLPFGYLGLALAFGGLAASVIRRTVSAPAVAGLMLVSYPVVYGWVVVNQSSLVYGRYLLPLTPMLAVGFGICVAAIAEAATSRWPRLRSAPLVGMLVVVVGPLAAGSAAWSAEFARPQTLDQAARWLATRPEPGQVFAIEGTTFRTPPRVSLLRVDRLIDRSADDYRAASVAYLVTTAEITDAYTPEQMAAHRALLSELELVQTFPPSPTRVGPTISIFRVPPRPPRDRLSEGAK